MKRQLFILLLIALVGSLGMQAAEFQWFGGRWWGVRVSYSLKWYTFHSGGKMRHANFWGEAGLMQGLEFGIPIQPRFGKKQAWGISTGVFGTVYSCVNDAQTRRIEDVGIYFPIHALYYHQFNRRFSIHAETGPGINVGILQDVIDPKDSTKKGYHLKFDEGSPRRVNWYWEFGVGATYRVFRFSVVYSLGLTKSYHFLSRYGLGHEYYPSRPHRLSFNVGLMF